MAANDKPTARSNRQIQKLSTGIQSNMDSIYKSTYFSNPQGSRDLHNLSQDITTNIDKIVNNNLNNVGIPNVSKLYSRMNTSGNQLSDGISKLFEDSATADDLYGSFMENKFLRDLDQEIDNVCKYMPRLLEALDTKKDNVLSADHFSKDFINVRAPVIGDETTFNERIKNLKESYNLLEVCEDIYDNAARYGEQFVYVIPYKSAFQKLLANKPQTQIADIHLEGTTLSIRSGAGRKNDKVLVESADATYTESTVTTSHDGKRKVVSESKPFLPAGTTLDIELEINESGIIDSFVGNRTMVGQKRTIYAEQSLYTEDGKIHSTDANRLDASGNLSFDAIETHKKKSDVSTDGLITSATGVNISDADKIKIDVPGCIVKLLDRTQVIPVYIDDICMGYYYIEVKERDLADELMGFKNILGDTGVNLQNGGGRYTSSGGLSHQDEFIRYLSGQLSQFIDQKFINNNQDLRKEIYMVLKYNDIFNATATEKIKVTFVQPEDMIHVYFKMDAQTHRGISDLDKALVPAKIYSSLYITNSIAILTRGQDKRVYYVKQTVESNIAKTLLNTVSQIKQSNFGIRQFQNINAVLNITGRFNDYIIPKSSSGEAPIEMEVLPGQNIDVKTELMNILEEMAINSTDVPLDIIQARQSADFATQLTMSNSKFLRKVYSRQAAYQKHLKRLVTRIFNAEFDENLDLDVTLPPPMFLNVNNTNQVINNTKEYVNSIVEYELADEQDELVKQIYTKDLMEYHLGTYIDLSKNENILARARMKAKAKLDAAAEE